MSRTTAACGDGPVRETPSRSFAAVASMVTRGRPSSKSATAGSDGLRLSTSAFRSSAPPGGRMRLRVKSAARRFRAAGGSDVCRNAARRTGRMRGLCFPRHRVVVRARSCPAACPTIRPTASRATRRPDGRGAPAPEECSQPQSRASRLPQRGDQPADRRRAVHAAAARAARLRNRAGLPRLTTASAASTA